MENTGQNVWIKLALHQDVNSLVVHGNAMFVIRHRMWKSARFYPHCENYQFVNFMPFLMSKLTFKGYPQANSAMNSQFELRIKKLSPMSTSLLLLLL